jgi:hypothetical protein
LQRGQDLVEVHGSTGQIISLTPGLPNSTVRPVDWTRNSPQSRRRIAQHLDYATDLSVMRRKGETRRAAGKSSGLRLADQPRGSSAATVWIPRKSYDADADITHPPARSACLLRGSKTQNQRFFSVVRLVESVTCLLSMASARSNPTSRPI